MINLTEEQAQQIEEAFASLDRAAFDVVTAQNRTEAGIAVRVLNTALESSRKALAVFRAARAREQLETPFQLGQRLAREGQGISAIVYEIERDSDFDECLRGMRSVWNVDNFVVKRKQVEQGPVTCDVCGEVLQFKGHDCTTSQTVQYDPFDPRDYLDPDTGEPYELVQPVQPVKQEPVGEVCWKAGLVGSMLDVRMTLPLPPVGTKLYIDPLRTKDLTDEEKNGLLFVMPVGTTYADIDAVIDKFKEKNK